MSINENGTPLTGGTQVPGGASTPPQGYSQSAGAQPASAPATDSVATGAQPASAPGASPVDVQAQGAASASAGGYGFTSASQTQPMDQARPEAGAPQAAAVHGAPQAGYRPQQPLYQAPSASAEKAKKDRPGLKTFLFGFAGAAAACVIALAGFGIVNMATADSGTAGAGEGASGGTTVLGSSGNGEVTAGDDDATLAEQVADKALPSVVAIDVYTEQQSWGGMGGMFGWGSGEGTGELTESSLGSGVVLTEDGYIITNYHVIEGSDALKVTIEGQEYDADVVGYDASSDIAVIKAQNASGLTPIEIGDSDSLSIGEWVMTIGSPFGLEQSVATGVVSATSRSQIMSSDSDGSTTIYTNLIQTDAAINPGNSGGALVDADGKLIGINTLITSYSGNYSGVGFAIPVNYAMELAQQIIDGEEPTHAQLGVTMTTVNSQIADRYGFAVDEGAYVSSVMEGSGAEAAGLQTGDIITSFDGQAISSADDLQLAVRSHSEGDTVEITFNRSGEDITTEVTLGSDANSQSQEEETTQQESGGTTWEDLFSDLLGGNGSSDGYGYGSGSNNGARYDNAA